MGRARLIWRGEVYQVDLGQPVGHEPAFLRPAVVVSNDVLNNGPGRLVVVVPVTSTDYGLRSHVELAPGTSGLDHRSFARCDQVRVVSISALDEPFSTVLPVFLARLLPGSCVVRWFTGPVPLPQPRRAGATRALLPRHRRA
ncbi:MAG: type II toxin-antitoxin system PemK/MazF family toxin [Acidimicrobiales bacterium]